MSEAQTMKADGFDDCVIGIGSRIDNNVPILVYDYDKCAQLLAKRDGMSIGDAYEYMDFNVVGAWVGEGTPLYIRTVDSMEEAEQMLSDMGEQGLDEDPEL